MSSPETAWSVWLQMQATENHQLPEAGGLLDQNEALFRDIGIIGWQSQVVESQVKKSMGPPPPLKE